MSDFERFLRRALQDVGESYEPSDQLAARERFLSRRRRRRIRIAVSGVAVTAAIVSVAVIAAPVAVDDPVTAVAAPEPVATVAVGEAPSSVVTGDDDSVWAMKADSMSVSRIDPATDEVVDELSVSGRPEEIVEGHGAVWVVDDTGVLTRFHVDGGVGFTESLLLAEGEEVHLDLAATRTGVVAVDQDRGTVYTVRVPDAGGLTVTQSDDFPATDVASGSEGTWLLDGPEGELTDGREVYRVPEGFNADLAVGAGRVWVANGTGGDVFGIDPETGEILTTATVGGRYTDLAVDEDSVWALTGGGQGAPRLRQIDARTGTVIGEPLEMEGDPRDVTASDGSAWVADADSAEVVRIDPADKRDDPVPDVTSEPTQDPEGLVDPDDVLFVFSADGDLFAQTSDAVVQLTKTPEEEIHPSVRADGRYVAFERTNGEGNDGVVGILDVVTGEECCLRDGTFPAFGPYDQIAWVVPIYGLTEPDEQAMIAIGPMEGPPVKQVSAAPPDVGVPFQVRNLAWDRSGEILVYEAGYEGFAVRTLDLVTDSDGPVVDIAGPPDLVPVEGAESGAIYTAISSATEFNVVRACCRTTEGDVYDEQVEFGELRMVEEEGYPYRAMFDLTDDGLRVAEQRLFVTYGEMPPVDAVVAGEVSFGSGSRSTWLLGDGDAFWLLTEGTMMRMPYRVDGGAAAPHPYFE